MGKAKQGIGFLLMTVLCLVCLTGCPRKLSDQEYQDIRTRADELFSKAMEADLGLHEGDYELIDSDVNAGTNSAQPITTYHFKVGDKTYGAVVDDKGKAVYSDYYAAQFKEALLSYIIKKIGFVPELKDVNYEIRDVGFRPWQVSIFVNAYGTIPTWVTPQRFEEYLEQCEKEYLIEVNVTANWYCVEESTPPDDMLLLMDKAAGRVYVETLTLTRYAKEDGTDLTPADRKEAFSYYSDLKPRHVYYENVAIGDNLVVTQTHFVDDANEYDGKTPTFAAWLDEEGHLHVNPGQLTYEIFYKSEGTGVMVRFAEREYAETQDFKSRETSRDERFASWWSAGVTGWNVVFEETK